MLNKREPLIITNIENGIQKVIYNRPSKKNAMINQMYEELINIMNDSSSNNDVNALVITGKGNFFSSGQDFITIFTDEFTSEFTNEINLVQQFVESLILYPKLLIAIVNGPAIGISATTLLLFDIVYASDTAYFWTPFCKLGLSPEGCSSYTFPRVMGPSKAGEMLYFGEKLNAKEALQVGLVSKVYKSGSINEIWAHLEKISSLSKESLLATKKLLTRFNKNLLIEINKQEIIELKKMYENPNFINHMANLLTKQNKI